MKILAIGAHFDDLELSCGGTLARFRKEGNIVYTIIATESDYTYYNGKNMRSKKQAEGEGYCGLLNLGIPKTNIINLKFPTKKIPYNNEIIELINKYIDELKPDLIITHHINSESHQDHLNLAKSVMAAARYQKNIWMFEPLYPSKMSNIPFRPIIFVDISKYLDVKIHALKVQTSQWKKYPYWKDLITSVARLRGIEIKTQYAEAFEPIKQEFPI